MTTFLDPRQRDAVLLLGAFHSMPHAQFSLGLMVYTDDADELIAALHARRWVKRQPATKHQRERYGQDVALALTPAGRMAWKRLLNEGRKTRQRRAA
ncbi:hypothetical protein ACFOPQ_01465 [Deinococcus antarcticus]|uniref:Winged helix DNA-binding protein n=1 Tax=Deinococcus antarcticus TaxID=1298767 RepID=A0ABV8A178_9DEIO